MEYLKRKAIVVPAKKPFLKFRNAVKTGRENIAADIKKARWARVEKHKRRNVSLIQMRLSLMLLTEILLSKNA